MQNSNIIHHHPRWFRGDGRQARGASVASEPVAQTTDQPVPAGEAR